MPDEEVVEDRHLHAQLRRGPRATPSRILKEGAAESGLGRRPLIRNTLIGALGLFAAAGRRCCCATSARCPATSLSTTMWRTGIKLRHATRS